MKQLKIIIDIREEDIDRNIINTEKVKNNIIKSLNRFWNIEAINYEWIKNNGRK